MSRERKGLRAVLREITHGADRSPLFWWMVEHHDDLAQAAEGRRMRWRVLCEQFEALGLTDVNGKPASERTARATWGRARRAVREARERVVAKKSAAPKRHYPSRVSRDWRPPIVEPSEPTPAASAPAPYDPDEQIARLKRIINSRSGRPV
jgi:hypothetical protein